MSKRENTERALIDAALSLLTNHAPEAISVKQIAAAAGVNHGLVHHYFGSKDALISTAMRDGAGQLYRDQPEELKSGFTYRFLRENLPLLTILNRIVLDGPDALLEHVTPPEEKLAQWTAQMRAIMQGLPIDFGLSAEVLNAIAVSAIMGWFTYRPLLRAGFGVPDNADDQIQAALDRLDALLEAVTGAGKSAKQAD